jgi:predicted aldo/keto reductase-like oxidoreductase
MLQVTLGTTNITVNKNGFGALPIQRISKADAAKILRKAYDNGVNYFDTARAYSDSEEKLGYALGGVRDKIVLATKTMPKDSDDYWKQLHESLRLLKTDHIDVYQFHNLPKVPRPGDGSGLYEAMVEAKKQGKILHIAMTNHSLAAASEIVESGLYEVLQFPFSYLAADRDIGLVKLCGEKNVGFVAMKSLSGGLITNSAAAYAWMAQYENVLPIWGIQRESELDEFLSYQNAPPALDATMTQTIGKDREELAKDFCRGCGYCLPCPAEIQIPTAARISLLLRRAPLQSFTNEFWKGDMKKTENCINCGHCKEHCPYGLDTPRLLRENYEDFKKVIAGKTHADL